MSRGTRIPKFGSWDSNDGSTPYTALFDDARSAKGSVEPEYLLGKHRDSHKVNHGRKASREEEGYPQYEARHSRKASREDAEGYTQYEARHRRRSSREDSEGYTQHEARHGRKASREDGEGYPPPIPPRRQIDPPAQRIQIDDSRYVPQVGHTQNGNDGKYYTDMNYRSPMRSTYRTASPARDKTKLSNEGSSTPGRSRLRNSNATVEPAEKAATLPKFGAWDANDPTSGDGFTMIFNNARNEKKAGGPVHIPPLGFDGKDLYPQRTNQQHLKSSTRKYFCCFQPAAGVEA